jgi:hypothetical protein
MELVGTLHSSAERIHIRKAPCSCTSRSDLPEQHCCMCKAPELTEGGTNTLGISAHYQCCIQFAQDPMDPTLPAAQRVVTEFMVSDTVFDAPHLACRGAT